MTFHFQPLKSDEIRLLQPLSHSSGPLCYRIVHVSLASKPTYAALSYTWGPPGDTHHISLNGQRHTIRQNLHDALCQISGTKLVLRYLWIDAICINQAESVDALAERNIQITHMKRICEQAVKVLVWLGLPDDHINNRLAFSLMKNFAKRFRWTVRKNHPYRPWRGLFKPQNSSLNDMVDFALAMSALRDKALFDIPGTQTHKAWLGIVSLWNSPWWTRTWIYREASIPKRFSVVFLCGNRQTGWIELWLALLVATKIAATPGLDSEFLSEAWGPVEQLLAFRGKRNQNTLRSFLDTLQSFRHTKCFDIRDKVYGPLCLAPDEVLRYITPDYATKTVLDVYTDVVRYYLAQPGYSLDFLGYTMYQEQAQVAETPQVTRSTIPSWVPNFAASLDIIPVAKILFVPEPPPPKPLCWDNRGFPTNTEAQIAAYRPLGGLSLTSHILDDILMINGVYIDVLKDTISQTGATKAVIMETSSRWAADMMYCYFTGESYKDAFGRTLIHDIVYDHEGRPSERRNTYDPTLMDSDRSELSPEQYMVRSSMAKTYHDARCLRVLGLSQKHYLLSIPNTAVKGDTIWAFAGGQVLYVLGSVNRELHQYIYIGECYGHGLMDGEVARQLDCGETRLEVLALV